MFLGLPNTEHLAEWAESQVTPMSRRIANKMVENLQYIAYEVFLKQLQTTIDDFHQQLNDEPYILLVGELRRDKLAEGCSDLWIIGLALEYCGLKEPEAILTPSQLKAWKDTNTRTNKILMLDDASYSGTQKNSILSYFIYQENGLKLSELSFYIGIPFMTVTAKNILLTWKTDFKELIILNHVKM